MNEKKILIIAGEPSGDLHAANLVRDLKSLDPNLRFFGLGGYLSKSSGVEIVFDISGLALVGLADVLKNILTVGKVYKGILKKVDLEHPDLAILIDYPGFNLRLAKELKSFIECVRTGRKPIVSGVEGRRALQVALEIIEKIAPSTHK